MAPSDTNHGGIPSARRFVTLNIPKTCGRPEPLQPLIEAMGRSRWPARIGVMSDNLSLAELIARWKQATEGQTPTGTVKTLVLRTGGGEHVTAQRLALDPRSGISGDRWIKGDDPDPDDQLSLIDSRVVEALVAGDAARLHVPGDNVVVDFDLGVDACP